MRDFKQYVFEYNVFKGLLIFSSIYWTYRTYTHAISNNFNAGFIIDVVMVTVTLLFLFVSRKYKNYQLIILIYSFFMLFIFVYFWYSQGGMNGPISYSFFSILAFFIATLPAKVREIICLTFAFIAVLLASNSLDGFFEFKPITESAKAMLPFDYVATSLLVAVIIVMMKRNFDKESRLIEIHSRNVKGLNDQQIKQTKELLAKQNEIKSLKNNLESLVIERTSELEKTKIELEEYAFHNAHLVRKPLSNILGLINILEIENTEIDKEKLKELKQNAQGLDLITKKINSVLQ